MCGYRRECFVHAIADADCASPPAIAYEAHGSQDCVCGRDGCESTEGSHSLDLYRPLSGDNPLPPASLTGPALYHI